MESYRTNLSPWAIFRCDSPNNTCIRRFRKRNDALDHLRILLQDTHGFNYRLVFDVEVTPDDAKNFTPVQNN